MEKIGRILITDQHGNPLATALWDLPQALRTPEVLSELGMLQAVRQDGIQWVYRVDSAKSNRPSDPDLKEYRYPDSADWDGPLYTAPRASLDDVKTEYLRLLQISRHGGQISQKSFTDFYSLVLIAWSTHE